MKNVQPITLRPWPRAILHMDADAFFASVEQAVNPELRGKPVVTGAERGIITSASYEAKALGITRGMRISELARLFPQCVMVSSDYEMYSIYSQNMFNIIRRFTPDVEIYSIDEAFADITGTRRLHRCHYANIGQHIQETIWRELQISVSVGISLSKSLAKLASKYRKPRGLTCVSGPHIHELLRNTPIEKIWGVGPNTSALLHRHACTTAFDFVNKPRYFAEEVLGKVGLELWQDLRGDAVYEINTEPKQSYGSISKTLTFTPASSNRDIVFAQLLRNLEAALTKARRFHLSPSSVTTYLKEQNFQVSALEIRLPQASASPLDLTAALRQAFDHLFRSGHFYRATGVVLHKLQAQAGIQFDLFGNAEQQVKTSHAAHAMDAINQRFGSRSIFLSPGLRLQKQAHVADERSIQLPQLQKIAV